MSKSSFQEEDVLDIAALSLREMGFIVLAVGGNQAGLFRFHTELGNRKAPDLVAFRDPFLLVFEAKVRAADLYRQSEVGQSDYSSMMYLIKSVKAQAELCGNAATVLTALGMAISNHILLVPGLIAATEFPKDNEIITNSGLVLIKSDPGTGMITVVLDDSNIVGCSRNDLVS